MAYFTLAELRAADTTLADTDEYADEQLEAMRDTVQESIEFACRVAFEPRTTTEIHRRGLIVLEQHLPTSLTEVTDAGQPVDVATLHLDGRRVRRDSFWRGPVSVTYVHGHEQPPKRIARAALTLAKVWLLKGPVTDRATQIAGPEGATINLATPGRFGDEFGVPEVDQAVRQYRLPKTNPFGL